MILANDVTVDASIEQTWQALMDVGQVATCLAGARIEPIGEDGSYRGALRVKVGPVTMSYEGTVRVDDVDETSRTLSYHAAAREANGAGGAAATIHVRLTALDDEARTRLDVETDLNVTGRAAQFGRGITQSVATKMLVAFAAELGRMIEAGGAEGRPAGAAGTGEPQLAGATTERSRPSASPASAQDAFELGGALSPLASRPVVAVFAAAVALAYLAGRRERTIRVRIVRPPE